jgi:Flp pilus assembly protein TadG
MWSERGSVSLLVVLVLPALLMAGGLVLDGGRQLQARRDANAAATAASRAATQLSVDEVYVRRLDAASARQRAQAELARQGATGVVSVAGQSVTVTVRASVDYALLPGGGTVTESSTSDPSEGVRTGSVTP